MNPDNCPHCFSPAAGQKHPDRYEYTCGHLLGWATRTDLCREREARQKAEAEIQKLKAEITRLQEECNRLNMQQRSGVNTIANYSRAFNDMRSLMMEMHRICLAPWPKHRAMAEELFQKYPAGL
jgi:uncharacterized protein YPO0396